MKLPITVKLQLRCGLKLPKPHSKYRDILVLDEPLSYLDKTFEKRLYKIVAEIAKDTTILLVSHEMSEIGIMANRHIIIDNKLEECTALHHYVTREC